MCNLFRGCMCLKCSNTACRKKRCNRKECCKPPVFYCDGFRYTLTDRMMQKIGKLFQ